MDVERINNDTYETIYRKKLLMRLINNGYIVIYDKQIIEGENKILVTKEKLTLTGYYKLIKSIYPYGYVTKNLVEIGHAKIKK